MRNKNTLRSKNKHNCQHLPLKPHENNIKKGNNIKIKMPLGSLSFICYKLLNSLIINNFFHGKRNNQVVNLFIFTYRVETKF